jgi:hypothetical protein
MNPSQRDFYDHLVECNVTFLAETYKGKPRNPYPHLAHLTTPALRYRNLVESRGYWVRNGENIYV